MSSVVNIKKIIPEYCGDSIYGGELIVFIKRIYDGPLIFFDRKGTGELVDLKKFDEIEVSQLKRDTGVLKTNKHRHLSLYGLNSFDIIDVFQYTQESITYFIIVTKSCLYIWKDKRVDTKINLEKSTVAYQVTDGRIVILNAKRSYLNILYDEQTKEINASICEVNNSEKLDNHYDGVITPSRYKNKDPDGYECVCFHLTPCGVLYCGHDGYVTIRSNKVNDEDQSVEKTINNETDLSDDHDLLSTAAATTELLNKEFNHLMSAYRTTIQVTEGCGERGQYYIDDEYNKLKEFVDKNPSFKNLLPSRYKCYNDGSYGLGTALSNYKRI